MRHIGRTTCWVLVFWVGWLIGVQSAIAQSSGTHLAPEISRRLVRRFDFEEAQFNNYEDLPMYWYAMGRPALTIDRGFLRQSIHNQLIAKANFPAYTKVGFDRPQSESGQHRLHLGLNGGNAGAFLEVGAVPVVPNSDYLVTTEVTTSSLKYARARILAYFVDSNGRRIDPSMESSDLIQTDGRTQILAVKLRGEFPEAAWMGIQVELLQVTQQPRATRNEHDVSYTEVKGDAWFDQISLWQLPHVLVRSQSPVNIIRSPDHPVLNVQLKDLTARPLWIDLKLYDHLRRPVSEMQRKATEWTPVNWKWKLSIDRYGWYLVDMQVFDLSGGRVAADAPLVARTMASFLWMPDELVMDRGDMFRFRIVAEGVPPAELALLPRVLDQTQIASLGISVWDPNADTKGLGEYQKNLSRVIQFVAVHGQDVVMSLYPIPQQLMQNDGTDSRNPITLFKENTEMWAPFLTPVMMRHGQRVHYWQLGTTAYPYAYFMPKLPELVESISGDFRAMAPRPNLILPWRLTQSRRFDVPSGHAYAIEVPFSVWPEHIGKYMDQWKESPKVEHWLHLREPYATQMTHKRRIDDLTLRMLYGWEAQPSGLSISRPWAGSLDRKYVLLPDPLLGVFRTVSHRLAGRRVIGHLPIGPGLECMILNGPSGGMLAAWNRSASDDQTTVDMFLGSRPEAVDVWGNRKMVSLVNDRHRLSLSRTPTFIEGIDPQLAAFRASFKIRPPFIESTVAEHHRVIEFTNPWSHTITGHLNIIGPESWDIQPSRHRFSIASGQTARQAVRLNFPVTETAGMKRLVAHFDFTANQRYQVDVFAPMELGLSLVGFDATLAIVTNPKTGLRDAIVTQMITNKSDDTIALYCFAHLVGFSRQERIIAKLEPGQMVIRRFIFRNAVEVLKKHDVRVGVRESIGPAVYNLILSGKEEALLEGASEKPFK